MLQSKEDPLDTRGSPFSNGDSPTITMVAPAQRKPSRLGDRDDSDPARCAVELVQRGRMVLDVSAADLEAAEAAFGPFHPTAWHFRNALDEARRSWDRLRAELGGAALEAALNEPPLTVLVLGGGAGSEAVRGSYHDFDRTVRRPPTERRAPVTLIPIGGRTYRVEGVAGTPLAPVQWRLTRLHPPHEDGPYYVCRLHDGSTQCDCADWTYQVASNGDHSFCKHLGALDALGWI
jgi:hypothetical protein